MADSPRVSDALRLSEELLGMMRTAAKKALDLNEGSITPRALLLAMLDDVGLGPRIGGVVNRDKLLAAQTPATHAERLPDDTFTAGDPAAVERYDTIAFKTPDGASSVWLARETYEIFIEGAQRAEDRYLPKHLAFGFAAEARHAPAVLAAIAVDPGALAEAIYRI